MSHLYHEQMALHGAGYPLRGMLPGEIIIPEGPVPYTVAIGGGKGGVGKSFIAAQTGLQFARSGRKTLLIDLDFGGANLHSYFKSNGQSPCLDPSSLTCDSFDLAEWISCTEHPKLDVIYGSRLFSGSNIKPKVVALSLIHI